MGIGGAQGLVVEELTGGDGQLTVIRDATAYGDAQALADRDDTGVADAWLFDSTSLSSFRVPRFKIPPPLPGETGELPLARPG